MIMRIKSRKTSGRAAVNPDSSVSPSPELLGMDEAIRLLKTTRPTFYRWLRSGKLKGMKAGRQWRFYREEIQRFLTGDEPQIALTTGLGPLHHHLERRARALGIKPTTPSGELSVDATIRLMIRLCCQMRASGIHIAPQITSAGSGHVGVLRFRVDGVLHVAAEFDARLLPAI